LCCSCCLAGLKKKLKDLMGEFSEMRARIHEENRQVVQRRVYTVTGQHLPEEDIDTMIETGESHCSSSSSSSSSNHMGVVSMRVAEQ
jgi:hypothetical protein